MINIDIKNIDIIIDINIQSSIGYLGLTAVYWLSLTLTCIQEE